MYYPYFWSALRQFNREKSVQVLVELICKQDTKLHVVTGFNQLTSEHYVLIIPNREPQTCCKDNVVLMCLNFKTHPNSIS